MSGRVSSSARVIVDATDAARTIAASATFCWLGVSVTVPGLAASDASIRSVAPDEAATCASRDATCGGDSRP